MRRDLYDGIEGLQGSTPIGARITVGRKGPTGQPIDRERLFVVTVHAGEAEFAKRDGGKYKSPRAELHPAFRAWNDRAVAGDPSTSTLYGNLAYPTAAEAWNMHLRCEEMGAGQGTPPGGGTWAKPPLGWPACHGDGKRASRFTGLVDGEPQYRDIPCPNALCQFRQERGGKVPCRPHGRLYLMLRWPDGSELPRMLVKLTTGSGQSCEAIQGLFDYVATFAREAGIERPNLMGLPVALSVGLRKSATKARIYPILSLTIDGDLVAFFVSQVERLRLAAGPAPLALPGGNLDPGEQRPEVLAEDLAAILPGPSLPATFAVQGDAIEEPDTEDGQEPFVATSGPPAVRDVKAERITLGRELRSLTATLDDAADLLADLLAEPGADGPRTVRDLTLEQIDLARTRLPEHPLVRG